MASATPPSLAQIVEALIFASPEPITTQEIVHAIRAGAAEAAAAARQESTGSDDDESESPDAAGAQPPREGAVEAAKQSEEWEDEERVKPIGQASGAGGEFPADDVAAEAPADFNPRKVTAEEVHAAIEQLIAHYAESGRAFTLEERASGWRIFTRPHLGVWVRGLFPERKPHRLSQPALETLAIIAYRQPITKAAIEAVRGVSIDGPLQKLLDMNVVRIAGRADVPGRPLLYETTHLFFEHFGIKGVDDLPNASELRRVALLPAHESKTPSSESEQPELPIEPTPDQTAADAEAPENRVPPPT